MNKNNGIIMYCYPGFFFLLEMPEHTELDTEHSDTMQFKNNIVRTTDEIYLLVVVPNGV